MINIKVFLFLSVYGNFLLGPPVLFPPSLDDICRALGISSSDLPIPGPRPPSCWGCSLPPPFLPRKLIEDRERKRLDEMDLEISAKLNAIFDDELCAEANYKEEVKEK